MKITSITLFMPTVVAAASLTLASSAFTPANAYGVSPTNAITFGTGDVGRTLDPMKWLVPKGSVGSDGILAGDVTAKAVITVDSFELGKTPKEKDFLTLTIKMLNTTAASLQSSILSFGLGIDQYVSSVAIGTEGNVFDNAILDRNNTFYGFQGIDICVTPNTKCNSQGGINTGLLSQETDTFALKIGGDFDPGIVTIASYPMKFQTEAGSFAVAGVPEPITMIGSGLALGFGALFKREASKKRSKDKVKS